MATLGSMRNSYGLIPLAVGSTKVYSVQARVRTTIAAASPFSDGTRSTDSVTLAAGSPQKKSEDQKEFGTPP